MQELEMIWAQAVLILVGGFLGAAVICAGAALAIHKLIKDDEEDNAKW